MDDTILVCLTNDEEMGTPLGFDRYKVGHVEAYLKADPRHAVVINHDGKEIAIWRGASEELTNFYIQPLPLEDPNDADGGDYTAEEAIEAALS